MRDDGALIGLDFFRLVADDAGDLFQYGDEAGSAEALGLREVSAAPERLALWGQEHRQRPAALLAEGVERGHVDLVDIRPLFPVDLDVDVETVHHRRHVRILEALMGHDVAPVAGGIATDRRIGFPVASASSKAALPQGRQWTGLSRC